MVAHIIDPGWLPFLDFALKAQVPLTSVALGRSQPQRRINGLVMIGLPLPRGAGSAPHCLHREVGLVDCLSGCTAHVARCSFESIYTRLAWNYLQESGEILSISRVFSLGGLPFSRHLVLDFSYMKLWPR
jgi:hypothetical protein